jgi:hypothetical protein
LVRQESDNLLFEAFNEDGANGVRGYELVDDLKSIAMKFFIKEESKEKENKIQQSKSNAPAQKPAAPEPQPITYKLVNDWDLQKMAEEKKDSKEPNAKQMQQLPSFVQVTVVMWEGNPRKERTVTFIISLFGELMQCPVPPAQQKAVDPAPAENTPKNQLVGEKKIDVLPGENKRNVR